MPSSIATALKKKGAKAPKKRKRPLWKGPEEDGVTQSLISGFIVCRERFRVKVVEGLKPAKGFIHKIEYGNMWHECEEAFGKNEDWEKALLTYSQGLVTKYRTDQEQIEKWYQVCKRQFRVYVPYWADHYQVKQRTPLMHEEEFCVPVLLPSGRTVKLRGKWDGVDIIGKGRNRKVWLQENKAKGDVDEIAISKQLDWDLQVMTYLFALEKYLHSNQDILPKGVPCVPAGVRYNVIRRPLSGGRHSIKQKKGQSLEAYYQELEDRIRDDSEFFFVRYKADFSRTEIQEFARQFLIPTLEQLCDWWEWITDDLDDPFRDDERGIPGGGIHTRHPYGVYNPMDKGRASDVDEYLNNGSINDLAYADTLFPELS